ncbi:sulfite exporter TauE/SafE family protein [Dyadobacter chenwenxiniae]|uniref:Sulfite exporter TauE/SafE family protein n=1 Tax=Dyadobacter chenwenxiniae TaxID=2906456 RepID=A0A9X1TLQ1_9BACT|nr:sulfite exporter TauE/SafE family protein [Dyadobacter chenwenxiniae]MCF0062608.1 sulfite exporter TauE/SafE family protein [Dyadobacter chenwenxiniae]UON83645.1 sulfite exporter TauE/SafE family protein [Dyadobacter chenwenxiniae]
MNNALPYLALTMGLLSSFHCIGMCGPIALALPVQRGNAWQRAAGLLIYNLGRAGSYALLGAVVGVFGNALSLMGYLKYVSVLAGVLMLAYVFWPKAFARYFIAPAFLRKPVNLIKKQMSALLHSRKLQGWFLLGSLNGLLPCGLVYLALMSSLATGSSAAGSAFMFVFGMGTWPAMMAIGFFKNWVTPAVRTKFHQITPVFIAFAGIWLLYRSTLFQYPHASHSAAKPITECHGK